MTARAMSWNNAERSGLLNGWPVLYASSAHSLSALWMLLTRRSHSSIPCLEAHRHAMSLQRFLLINVLHLPDVAHSQPYVVHRGSHMVTRLAQVVVYVVEVGVVSAHGPDKRLRCPLQAACGIAEFI
jgi:hypothetical protein